MKLYAEERNKLVRIAAACIAAGVAQRQIQLAERQAQELARVITAVLTDRGLDGTKER